MRSKALQMDLFAQMSAAYAGAPGGTLDNATLYGWVVTGTSPSRKRETASKDLHQMNGRLILARPHGSLWDGPRLAWWLTHAAGIRGAFFPVDPDYARHPLWAPLLRGYGCLVGGHRMIPLDSESPFGLRTLARALLQGQTVVLFPQGTGLRDGIDRPDRPGARWLIRQTRPKLCLVRLEHRRIHLDQGANRYA